MNGAPVRYSVKASATRPSMAKRPFQSSASALMKPPLLASALSPLRRGTSDATERTAAVAANQASPDPLPACERRPPPRDASTASADTKPTMASRPLMRSGAGPLNASASHSPGLAGFFAALGSSVVGSASSAWARTTSARRRGASADAGTRTGNPPARARAPAAAKAMEPMEDITVAAIGVGGARVRWIGDEAGATSPGDSRPQAELIDPRRWEYIRATWRGAASQRARLLRRRRRGRQGRRAPKVHARDVEGGRNTASWAATSPSTWTARPPRRAGGGEVAALRRRKVAEDSRTTQGPGRERAGDDV
ncbi:hypothetical protein SETIT_2G053400v2 [Setaria italica]|uniref:Uncharacterized protein n=1 Tax=Setaria italica TaxID=4555 RepID=A0A368PVD2_SETIT|nr:hypothetical protein SETIT_2G053400v2 [Setaria italica]